ncbi:MAG: hypothetical protein HN478_00850 [Rhodospirillaceae bacterium]|jgi:hypothetical protein|nr:hypothetical protein [Rhodospirillaceae bacterium]MBT4491284.1 hypothetical protein [Rhodospirillaceae bacterium]MBT5193635.1 hypothetical protein [Rhodospirillaceae bacterium]MBT5895121.1 hypothetical protein [Rhodospirillaceae bacterium]MBT6427627.1 hypothetical protein [Rhodospirillaceae bacterium]
MTEIEVAGERLPIRESLVREMDVAWNRLASAGTWWTAAERLAIAAEARHAGGCGLCQRRKEALSPYTVDGDHDSLGELPNAEVEAIHRLVTDAGRITEKWVRSLDLEETHYVEIIGVIAVLTGLDTLHTALGLPLRDLPAAQPGAPVRKRPLGAKHNLAWVATLAPEDVGAGNPDPYPVHGDKNIHRGFSLVPQEVFNFFDLDVELYLKDHEIRDFETEYRAISHAQIEFIAGRTSALNGCFY